MNVLLGTAIVEEDPEPTTRCGYKPGEAIRAFESSLLEGGAVAVGKTLHFSADIVCSGGYDVWVKGIWEYVIHYVGLSSPRVFVYLHKRIRELDELFKKYPDETLYHNDEFHTRIGEILMVLREVPRRPKVVWPRVGPETHLDGWIKSVATAGETEVLRKVWRSDGDMMILRTAGAEILKAITEASTAKVLFWIRWLYEEDAKLKKETKGASLTTIRRFEGASGMTETAQFIAALLAETYKEFATKQLIRMTEEFQCMLELIRGADVRISPANRKQILGILAQILCEVPKWKVPAAPALIKDPIQVSRAVTQTGKFFREVLVNKPVQNNKRLVKLLKSRGVVDTREKKKKVEEQTYEEKMAAMDKAMAAFMGF